MEKLLWPTQSNRDNLWYFYRFNPSGFEQPEDGNQRNKDLIQTPFSTTRSYRYKASAYAATLCAILASAGIVIYVIIAFTMNYIDYKEMKGWGEGNCTVVSTCGYRKIYRK